MVPKMLRWDCCVIILFSLLHLARANDYSRFCASNGVNMSLGCSIQLAGQQEVGTDICKVETYRSNSQECKHMDFGPINSNAYIGGVSLKPYLLVPSQARLSNYTVLNITFTNIKWKTMKFRFQPTTLIKNHCRNIMLSNDVNIDDRSVLYYDCYWSATLTDGDYNNTSHILDFEATGEKEVNRGQYYFNIPNMQMMSPYVNENEWKPFLYIEILPSTLRLHIMPPPAQLRIIGYKIEVRKGCAKGTPVADCDDELLKKTNISLRNNMQEVTYDFYYLGNSGFFYFAVTPLHGNCPNGDKKCQVVASPKIAISNEEHKTLNICIASVSALVVATLFAYYIVLRIIRRYWCKDYQLALRNEIPAPTKVLVVYSPASRLHAECVATFVSYLRSEYGFEVLYDGDIAATTHGDPYIWAEEAVRISTHVLYVVGPTEERNLYNNIYEKPIGAHKDVDILLLSMLKACITRNPKHISNVFFEHSNGPVPIETKYGDKFYLLRDWQKLISHLSKNLLPKKTIMRTEKGRCFLEELTKAKKMLGGRNDGNSLV